MATTSTPQWAARHDGILGQADATARAADINQLLGTHSDSPVYQGNQIVTPTGQGGTDWALAFDTLDIDQPFTMSGTAIGRVTIPVLPVGNGADLVVSLCNDNSGNPGAVITRTRVPATWINQLAAVNGITGPSVQPPSTQYTNNALAVAQFNALHQGTSTKKGYAPPAATSGGPSSGAMNTAYGNYLIFVGGVINANTAVSGVFTIPCDTAGNVGAGIPQPSLVTPNDGSCGLVVSTEAPDGNLYVVMTGGATTFNGSPTTATYTAQFDASSGSISAWSAQAALPQALQWHVMAAWNGYVYTVGGGSAGNAVYYGQLQNGQITAWNTGPSLPQAATFLYATAINAFLFAIGNAGAGTQTNVYYAPINSDGSLGSWQNGPSLPSYGWTGIPALNADSYGIVAQIGTTHLMTLGVSGNGPDIAWQVFTEPAPFGGGLFSVLVPVTSGQWQFYTLYGSTYLTVPIYLTPRISVPLPATGLTNSATYHILLQQPNGSTADYLRTSVDLDALPGNPTLRTSPKNTWTWTANPTAGTAIPIGIYDNSNGTANANGATGNNVVWHTWQDNGARITTLVRATTPDQRLIGICESTVNPTALNSNTGFETTISPWTTGTGTLVRSNTQAYEGTWSARMTPNGTSANVFFQSENLPCVPGVSYTVTMWVYAVNTITSNFSATLFWYNAGGTFISESDNLVSIPANTWTLVSNTFTAPSGAYQLSINPRQSGTPPVGNVFYVDNAWAYETSGGAPNATVSQVTYAGTWPGSAIWPATGVTRLA